MGIVSFNENLGYKSVAWAYFDDHYAYGKANRDGARFDENGNWHDEASFYDNNQLRAYMEFENNQPAWRVFFNQDGTFAQFTCESASCGGAGYCRGSECFDSGSPYASFPIPTDSSTLPSVTDYYSDFYISELCAAASFSFCQ